MKLDYRFKLQFITHQTDALSYLEGVKLALQGGCKWIQLRCKDMATLDFVALAYKVRKLCDLYGAIMILDDRVDMVETTFADGVHLGKHDMPIAEARALLGSDKIIGGTANTFDDVLRLAEQGVDYIGLGPYQFTHTKENLSPVLGLDGTIKILQLAKEYQIDIPIISIGGIMAADAKLLHDAAVDGIAISGAVLNSIDPAQAMQVFKLIIIGEEPIMRKKQKHLRPTKQKKKQQDSSDPNPFY